MYHSFGDLIKLKKVSKPLSFSDIIKREEHFTIKSKILKYNPYHDEKGRFTTASGAFSISESDKKTKEVKTNNVQQIGKIDKNIYKCVTKDIQTEDVIITNERIEHIKERHPNDFERYCQYISKMLQEPEYIFESERPNTAIIMNTFTENGKNFELILRLKTSADNEGFKNSIITFLKISDRKRDKYIRNKKILYKSE